MTRATWMVARMAKTIMDSQKPSLPEFFTASSPVPRPAAIDWKLVIMSLPWKDSSTSMRTPATTDSNSTPSQIQTVTLSGPLK